MTALQNFSSNENPQLRNWLQTLHQNRVLPWHTPTDSNTDFSQLLAPLLEAVGWQGDILSLTDVLPQKNAALTLDDVLAVLVRLGYQMQRESTDANTLQSEDLPALFVLDKPHDDTHAWVVWESGAHGFIWEDGARQHHGTLPEARGILYRFNRKDADESRLAPEFETPTSWSHDILQRFKPLMWHALGLSLAIHCFMLAMPIFSMVVYDRVVATHAIETLPLLALGVFGAFMAELTLRILRTRMVAWLGARLELVVGQAMFERLLFLPAALVEQATSAAQLARVRAFETVRDFITGPMFQALLEVPFITVLLIALAIIAGPPALVGVAVIVVYALMLTAYSARFRRLNREVAHKTAQRQQLTLEIVDSTKHLLTSGMAARVLLRFKALNKHTARLQHHYAMLSATIQHLASLVTVIAGIVIINWCLNRIWAGQMTGGAMVASMIITWRLLYPMQTLCTLAPHIDQVRAALRQVAQVMSLAPEPHADATTLAQQALNGTLEFHNVSLRYGRGSQRMAGDPVFWGLNAAIQPGQIVAVFGGNGSGKSSILRLVMGLYPPALGSIRLNGLDHRQLDPRTLRRQIAYLPQDPELLPGTIADNLRTVLPTATDADLRRALERADAWEQISALPQGLDTMLGGTHFAPSSGLAARLCLARLYLDPRPITLCDELPVQVLNGKAGANFRAFLTESRRQRTVLFVTHREDWMMLADQVIWLRPGLPPAVVKPHDITVQSARGQHATPDRP